MKDMFFQDDVMTPAPAAPTLGHSIRPRRALVEQAKRRLQDQSFNAPNLEYGAPAPVETPSEAPLQLTQISADWNDLPLASAGARRAQTAAMPVVDAARDDASVRAFDQLRTKLRQVTREKGWVHIGITAPTAGAGTTFTAVNLALSLSRVPGSRNVLMDMNLRNPGVADAFDIAAQGDMEDYLSGREELEDHLLRVSDTLALGLSAEPSDNAAEVLQDRNTGETLVELQQALNPDLVIYDLPPMLSHDDVSAFLPQLDAVLIVSDGEQTQSRDLLECEQLLGEDVPLLGVVLNRARASSIRRFR